jgi:hypothetical protein
VRSLVFVVALIGAIFTSALARPAAKEPSGLTAVLIHAGDYVVRFEHDLATIVAEEQYAQDVHNATSVVHRELRSDLLFVRPAGTNRYIQFRDVFEVDGHRVRDRAERLLKVAADPSALSMGQIVAESARYNIGDIERTINVPLLPLTFLLPENQWRFKFSVQSGTRAPATRQALPSSPHFTVSTEVWVVEYREVERHTLIRSVDGSQDVPAHGRFWIEPTSGRVRMSEFVAEDRAVHSTIDVSYQSEPLLDLLVPIEMRETYWRFHQPTRIEGAATYGSFRRIDATP